MSDTPISDSTPHNVADLGMQIRRLERQLNAANKLIDEIEKSGVYEGRPIDKTYLTIDSDVLSTMVSEKAYDPQATIRELQDRIKRLEEALDLVRPSCSSVHHSKKHQHKYDEPCPVVAFIENVKEAKP